MNMNNLTLYFMCIISFDVLVYRPDAQLFNRCTGKKLRLHDKNVTAGILLQMYGMFVVQSSPHLLFPDKDPGMRRTL